MNELILPHINTRSNYDGLTDVCRRSLAKDRKCARKSWRRLSPLNRLVKYHDRLAEVAAATKKHMNVSRKCRRQDAAAPELGSAPCCQFFNRPLKS